MRIVKIILLCALVFSCDEFGAYEEVIITETKTTTVYEEIMLTEEVGIMSDVYKNDSSLHLPEWVIGKWRVRETGAICEVTEEGFLLSPEASLYPNPVTSSQFIEADGSSTEEVGDSRYYIKASGSFLHESSGKKYSGSIEFEFLVDGDTTTLNGKEVVID